MSTVDSGKRDYAVRDDLMFEGYQKSYVKLQSCNWAFSISQKI